MKHYTFRIAMLSAVIAAGMGAMTAGNRPHSKLSPAMKIAMAGKQGQRNTAGNAAGCISAFITIAEDFDLTQLSKLGVKTGVRAGNIITARIPSAAVADVSSLPGVEYIEAAGGVTPMTDFAKKESGLPYDIPYNDTDPIPCTGKGVIIGIIDRGFDYNHEAFRDESGNCRITRIWEQGSTSQEYPSPDKYGYGVELTDAAAILAAEGDVKGNSHGTHVAGIAAGSSTFRDCAYHGAAPESEIVLVSMDAIDGDNTKLADAIDYIFDYADKEGKPCVINMSLGSQIGPHDGTSPFDRIADNLSGPGRLLVGSAGNHGNDKFHVSHSFTSSEESSLSTFIDFKKTVNTTNAGGTIDIWGAPGLKYRVELFCYSKGKKIVTESLPVDMEAEGAVEYNFSENITGPVTVAVETNPGNGKLHVMMKSGINSLRSRHYAGIKIISENSGNIDIWADNNYLGLSSNGIDGYTEPGKEYSTIAEIGGTAASVLTVGAYTTREEYTVMGSTDVNNIGQPLGDICSFSSYGPTADGRPKPEISAPGCFILSAVSSHDNSGTQIIADYNEEGGHRYGYMQGTSMSAPFVAGIVAGWLQIYPALDPAILKETVKETARRDNFTDSGDEIRWGAGKINPREGALRLISNGVSQLYGDNNEGKPIIWSQEIIFPRSGKAVVTVSDMAGRILSSTHTDVQAGNTLPLSVETVGSTRGIYVVRVTTSEGTATSKVSL